MTPRTRKWLTYLLALVSAVCLSAALYLTLTARSPEPVPAATAPPTESLPPPKRTPAPVQETKPPETDGVPVGKLVITPQRKAYTDGSLSIYIPTLNMTRTIYDGTDEDTLSKGVGLYDYAQLPGEGNCNVSLAGHRNGLDKKGRVTDHAPFYYVDQLKEGDYLYLTDATHVYRYLYEFTQVVEEDDWSPIHTTEYSCLTITSCTPIGVSDHRIVVRGKLDQIFEASEGFEYLAEKPAEEVQP